MCRIEDEHGPKIDDGSTQHEEMVTDTKVEDSSISNCNITDTVTRTD